MLSQTGRDLLRGQADLENLEILGHPIFRELLGGLDRLSHPMYQESRVAHDHPESQRLLWEEDSNL